MSDESNQSAWTRVISRAEPHFTEIAQADGNLVTFKREAMFAHQAISGSEYLQKCAPESIFNAIVNVASVGITLSPAEKLAYLVPRYNKDQGATLCCLDISYRGLKKIAEDSGAVQTAVVELVHQHDTWEWVDKLTKPIHKYDPLAPTNHRGDIRGGYCVAVLPNGLVQVEPMSLEEIEKVQAVSQAKNGPWKTWWTEMAKKTLVRRASKMWPHSKRLAEANFVLDAHQGLTALAAPEPEEAEPRRKMKGSSEPDASDAHAPAAAPAAPPVENQDRKGEGRHPSPEPPKERLPMRPAQAKMLENKMGSCTLVEFVAQWGAPPAQLFFDQFNEVSKWLSSRAQS